ncbi:MAG: acetyl-CoA hydrolase/transferase C-terminal domain-containing protein [Porticoccaceae bacterium]
MTQKAPLKLSVESIRQHFVDGLTIFVEGGCGQPDAILDLISQAKLTQQLRIIDSSVPTMQALDANRISTGAILNSGFFLGEYRALQEAGRFEFTPAFHSARYRAMEEAYDISIALIKVSPPDAAGFCSVGLHGDYSAAMLARATLVIAEINAHMPYIADAPKIALSDIDYVVEGDGELLEYAVAEGSETDLLIAEHIAGLVEDGDCLQLGIGSLPVSIMKKLGGKQHLGVHTGLLTEAFMPLVEGGVVDGSRKSQDKGKITAGVIAGSREFYRWCESCPDLQIRPVSYTHDAGVLAQIDNLVAINTTLEIDLFGQFNSETIRGKQIGGGGGLIDFLRGAQSSKGGRSILALQATAKRGAISKIVPILNTAPVTGMRSDIDYVVTEYGIARLANLSLEKRAEALIDIAHPDFRVGLTQQWAELLSKF